MFARRLFNVWTADSIPKHVSDAQRRLTAELMTYTAVTGVGLMDMGGRPGIMVHLLRLDPEVIALIPAQTPEGVEVRYELSEQAFAADGLSRRRGLWSRLIGVFAPPPPSASPR